MGKQFRPIKVTPNQWMKIFENRQIEVSLFEDPKLNPGDMVVVNPVKTDGRVLDGLPLLMKEVEKVETEKNHNHLPTYIVRFKEAN